MAASSSAERGKLARLNFVWRYAQSIVTAPDLLMSPRALGEHRYCSMFTRRERPDDEFGTESQKRPSSGQLLIRYEAIVCWKPMDDSGHRNTRTREAGMRSCDWHWHKGSFKLPPETGRHATQFSSPFGRLSREADAHRMGVGLCLGSTKAPSVLQSAGDTPRRRARFREKLSL